MESRGPEESSPVPIWNMDLYDLIKGAPRSSSQARLHRNHTKSWCFTAQDSRQFATTALLHGQTTTPSQHSPPNAKEHIGGWGTATAPFGSHTLLTLYSANIGFLHRRGYQPYFSNRREPARKTNIVVHSGFGTSAPDASASHPWADKNR